MLLQQLHNGYLRPILQMQKQNLIVLCVLAFLDPEYEAWLFTFICPEVEFNL